MSDHEQLHEAREQDADQLERHSEQLGEDIEEARNRRDRAADDDFIAAPAPREDPDKSGPESDYPTKD
jgi:hypothetical protein